jgi:hypothetical protein
MTYLQLDEPARQRRNCLFVTVVMIIKMTIVMFKDFAANFRLAMGHGTVGQTWNPLTQHQL